MNRDLQQLLEDDSTKLAELCDVLESERACLEARDLASLSTLLQQKQRLLANIEQNDFKRRQLLQAAGVPADHSSVTQLKNLLAESGNNNYSDLLDTIEQQLQRCRELSEVNGVIVHRSKLNTQKILDILRGSDTLAGVYTPHGAKLSSANKRDLGQA